jgi:hypothetical protein
MFNLRSNLFEGVGEDAAHLADQIDVRARTSRSLASGA